MPQEPHIQPLVTPESDDEISDADFTIVDSSSPSARPPPCAEQRSHSRKSERSRSRERVYPRSSSHESQQQQPVVPPPSGIQQNQAIQSQDKNSVTVDPQIRVSNHSRSPQNQEDTRRRGPQTLKAKKNTAEKQPSTPQKAKKKKLMDSDDDDEKPKSESGTSSNSQTTVPVLPLHQRPVASLQGPAASASCGDQDIE